MCWKESVVPNMERMISLEIWMFSVGFGADEDWEWDGDCLVVDRMVSIRASRD